ncbi:MAG: helix-turn-helix transcriptional regulator [Clostridia bacterium]|nr:helix-turn-helix transcriptional regulator [Clostridia bacterium]
MQRTGRTISALREQRGLSVKQLQERLGLATPQAIYKWQRGETMPTVDNLVILAGIFSVPLDDLVEVDYLGRSA